MGQDSGAGRNVSLPKMSLSMLSALSTGQAEQKLAREWAPKRCKPLPEPRNSNTRLPTNTTIYPRHALQFPHSPPRMGLSARLSCSSPFVPSVASLCNAPSRTTLGHFPSSRCPIFSAPRTDHPHAGRPPKDSGILRTGAQHNQGYVGIYAVVVQGGTITRIPV
jgi:hypothetical protein